MAEGGVVEISLKIEENHPGNARMYPGDYIVIDVHDTGPGIPKEFHSRVFDPYFSTKQEGSGLGLAISYSIIQKHSGFI